MPVTKIKTKWVSGELVFYNASTGATVLKIGANGVNFVYSASASPSVSPSNSPSESPSTSPSNSPSKSPSSSPSNSPSVSPSASPST